VVDPDSADRRGRLAVDSGRAEAITSETIRRIFEVDVRID
jgi:hypothetical protein